jgi:DNA-binding transcriptional MerR regulator
MAVYDAAQMAKRAGITERQLRTWTVKNYLRLAPRAQGVPRQWPEQALRKAKLMKRLTEAGMLSGAASAFCDQDEVAEALHDGDKFTEGTLGPGLSLHILLREDWQ